ncbi:Endonuclease-reverse transcriptase [Popillia japonica]|uniref:Endonuclease-reverse transcriptase n=1 Tax=Popillia japonica TaxID=7064 RepID=A0AAW1IB44_POPJA
MEAIGAQFTLRRFGLLNIYSIYVPPRRGFDPRDVDRLLTADTPALVAGDFNAKHRLWGCRVTNEPTFFRPGAAPDILDLVVVKNIPSAINVEVISELSSDHNPLLISYEEEATVLDSALSRSVNWRQFERGVSDLLPGLAADIPDAESLVGETLRLTEGISECLKGATTYKIPVPDKWVPGHLRDLICRRRRAKKRAQTTLYPVDVAAANALSKELRTAIRSFREEKWWDSKPPSREPASSSSPASHEKPIFWDDKPVLHISTHTPYQTSQPIARLGF